METAPHAYGEFVLVEEVHGPLKFRRNRIVPVDDAPPRPFDGELYRSVYVSDGRLREYVQDHKGKDNPTGIRGFSGSCTILQIPFDIDREMKRGGELHPDWERAINDARQFLEAMCVLHDVDLGMVKCYLTGGRGAHIYLPAQFFGGFAPSEFVPDLIKAIARELAAEAAVQIDPNIYDRNRLMRVPNSRHPSGKYCVPLYTNELIHVDGEPLLSMMDRPRPEITWIGEVEPVESLVELKRRCEGEVKAPSHAGRSYPEPPEERAAEILAFLESQNVEFDVRGDDFVLRCPTRTHDDREPSFRIQRKSGIYHCFGCEVKGSWTQCKELVVRNRAEALPPDGASPPSLVDIKNTCRRWLYIEDDTFIDVVLAAVVAHNFPGDPVWLFLVGPRGSCKTELLRTLTSSKTYTLSSLTQHTLISGLKAKGGADPSLLPKLDGKVLVMKDFTTMLSARQEVRADIFGQLRDIYDGYCEKSFGSGVGKRGYKCHLGLVVGVTPVIDRYSSVDQALGERFLKFRLSYKYPDKAVRRARENAGEQLQMRSELSGKVRRFLERDWECNPNAVGCSEEMGQKIDNLASLVALLRTAVPKNRKGELEFLPEPEVGTRLCQQFAKLGAGLALVRGKSAIEAEEYEVLARVGRDSVPSLRWRIVAGLMENNGREWRAASEIGSTTDIATETMTAHLNDLRLIGAADRKGDGKYEWRPSARLTTLLENSGVSEALPQPTLV